MVGSIRTTPTNGIFAIGNSFVDINLEWAAKDQVNVWICEKIAYTAAAPAE